MLTVFCNFLQHSSVVKGEKKLLTNKKQDTSEFLIRYQGCFHYREAAEGEDLPVHEEHGCVVTACGHLNTGARQGLHQSWRTPNK